MSRGVWKVYLRYDAEYETSKERTTKPREFHYYIKTNELKSLFYKLIEEPDGWYPNDFWIYSDLTVYCLFGIEDFCKSDKNDFILSISGRTYCCEYYSCENKKLTKELKEEIFEFITETLELEDYKIQELKEKIEKSRTIKGLLEKIYDIGILKCHI